MLKSFLRLMAFIIFPFVFVLYVEPLNPVKVVNQKMLQNYIVSTYGGIFFLVEENLKNEPKEQWSKVLASWQKEFAYDTDFVEVDQLPYDASVKKKLAAGQWFYRDQDPPQMLMRKIQGTSMVMRLKMQDSQEKVIEDILKGPIFLFERYFRNYPQEQWAEQLEKIEPEFGLDLGLTHINDMDLPEQQMNSLKSGKVARIEHSSVSEDIYWRFSDSPYVISIGPVSELHIQLKLLTSIFGVMLLIISLGILSWLLPLWRDLKILDQTAKAFGLGNFDRRVKFKRSSVVSRLGTSFNGMADSIQKLIQTNQHLTNAVAHDLRTPLARLRFALEILESGDCTPEEQARYKKSVHNSIDGLDYLINQLLIFSRYNRVAKAENFSPCLFSEEIKNEIEEHQFLHESLCFQCDISEAAQQKEIVIDQRALCRALGNLLTNASKFAKSQVLVRFYSEHNDWYLVVEDDGPGIDEKYHEKVFQAFVQLDNEERDEALGHGLGLAIVSQIAQWHKGSAFVGRSERLGGAKLMVCWPV